MTRKVNDIIEYRIDIEILAPETENITGKIIDPSNYKREYNVSCCINNTEEIYHYSLEADEGFTCVEDNIEGLIKEEMAERFQEVTDYEIFDVYNEYDYQTAKVKVKSIKE